MTNGDLKDFTKNYLNIKKLGDLEKKMMNPHLWFANFMFCPLYNCVITVKLRASIAKTILKKNKVKCLTLSDFKLITMQL